MRESCSGRLANDEDAKACDARPGCVADRLNNMCINIPDCSSLSSASCESVSGCFFDGSRCVSSGLSHKSNIPLPRVVNVPTRPGAPAPAPAPPSDRNAPNARREMQRFSHLCVPHDAQAPTMLATAPEQCKYPCEAITSFEDCTKQAAPSRMCQWSNDACRALPKKYEVVEQRLKPGRFADLLQQKSASLVVNPNM